jgi:hypothetical protein
VRERSDGHVLADFSRQTSRAGAATAGSAAGGQQPPAQHRRKLRAKRKTPPTQSINGTPKRRSLEEWTGVACKLHV